jgi:hypothetical protein
MTMILLGVESFFVVAAFLGVVAVFLGVTAVFLGGGTAVASFGHQMQAAVRTSRPNATEARPFLELLTDIVRNIVGSPRQITRTTSLVCRATTFTMSRCSFFASTFEAQRPDNL